MLARDMWSSWISWTPTYAGGAGGVIGNGTTQGRYRRWGCNMLFVARLVWGSTTTADSGAVLTLSMPAGLVRRAGTHIGNTGRTFSGGAFIDSSAHANSRGGFCAIGDGGGQLTGVSPGGVNQVAVTDVTPFAWATGDIMILWGACPIEGW